MSDPVTNDLIIRAERLTLRFGGVVSLRDASGSVHLSHSLGLHPTGIYVVRGFLDAVGDDRIFDVGRFAPAFESPPSPAP